jgi:hypothetical protein
VATALVFYTYDHFILLVAPYAHQALLPLYRFLSFKWGFDTVYNRFINKPLLQGAYNIPFSLIDKGLLEQVGPTGFGKAAVALGYQLTKAQTGRITTYGGVLLLAALLCALLFVHLDVATAAVLMVLPLHFNRAPDGITVTRPPFRGSFLPITPLLLEILPKAVASLPGLLIPSTFVSECVIFNNLAAALLPV